MTANPLVRAELWRCCVAIVIGRGTGRAPPTTPDGLQWVTTPLDAILPSPSFELSCRDAAVIGRGIGRAMNQPKIPCTMDTDIDVKSECY